jgi:lipopolysaccharide/colanic/teichoic acid biosynthesis glycosyltransferase
MMVLKSKIISLVLIRAADISLSIGLLLFLLPILFAIPIIILVSTGAPIIFAQTRVGKNKKEFIIYKFRSMHHAQSDYIGGSEALIDGNKPAFDDYKRTEKNDLRITKEGKWLRKLHFDELPQLWNVLIGDMSLVGPRPDAPVQKLVCDEFRWNKRHQVRPGITGLSQITPEVYHSNDERINCDLIWVEKISVSLYFLILFQTFTSVLFRKTQNY